MLSAVKSKAPSNSEENLPSNQCTPNKSSSLSAVQSASRRSESAQIIQMAFSINIKRSKGQLKSKRRRPLGPSALSAVNGRDPSLNSKTETNLKQKKRRSHSAQLPGPRPSQRLKTAGSVILKPLAEPNNRVFFDVEPMIVDDMSVHKPVLANCTAGIARATNWPTFAFVARPNVRERALLMRARRPVNKPSTSKRRSMHSTQQQQYRVRNNSNKSSNSNIFNSRGNNNGNCTAAYYRNISLVCQQNSADGLAIENTQVKKELEDQLVQALETSKYLTKRLDVKTSECEALELKVHESSSAKHATDELKTYIELLGMKLEAKTDACAELQTRAEALEQQADDMQCKAREQIASNQEFAEALAIENEQVKKSLEGQLIQALDGAKELSEQLNAKTRKCETLEVQIHESNLSSKHVVNEMRTSIELLQETLGHKSNECSKLQTGAAILAQQLEENASDKERAQALAIKNAQVKKAFKEQLAEVTDSVRVLSEQLHVNAREFETCIVSLREKLENKINGCAELENRVQDACATAEAADVAASELEAKLDKMNKRNTLLTARAMYLRSSVKNLTTQVESARSDAEAAQAHVMELLAADALASLPFA